MINNKIFQLNLTILNIQIWQVSRKMENLYYSERKEKYFLSKDIKIEIEN
jgi:hypothetical protein